MSTDEFPEDLNVENWLRSLRSEEESVRETAKRRLLERVARRFGGVVRDVWLDFPKLHPYLTEDDFRQDVFCRVEATIDGLKAESLGQFRRWVVNVIRSAAIDEYRRVRGPGFLPNRWGSQIGAAESDEPGGRRVILGQIDSATGVLTGARRTELYNLALTHLQGYSDVDREIVRLRVECDLSFSEIAAELRERGLVGPGRQHEHLSRFQISRIYDRVLVELQGCLGSRPSKI
jgi:RNA polymerase sigma factor (sigma-70 family)